MSRVQELQKVITLYRVKTGESDLDMMKIALFAMQQGIPMPTPKTALEMMAAQLRDAARQDVRKDNETGRPYRAYHAVPALDEKGQGTFYWIDIDDPATTFDKMRKSMVRRREQIVDDGVQLSLDLDHWNSMKPDDQRIVFPWDIGPDIEWAKNAMDIDDEKDAA